MVAHDRVYVYLLANGKAGLEHLVDQARKRAINALPRFRTRFEGVYALFRAEIAKHLAGDLAFTGQVALVSDDDDGDVADLGQLLDPLANAGEGVGVGEVEDHEAGVEALDVGADYVRMLFLPSRVPNLHLGHRIPQNADMHRLCVRAVRFDLLDAERGLWVDVFENHARLADVEVAEHGDLDGCLFVAALGTARDHIVPHFRRRDVGRGRHSLE